MAHAFLYFREKKIIKYLILCYFVGHVSMNCNLEVYMSLVGKLDLHGIVAKAEGAGEMRWRCGRGWFWRQHPTQNSNCLLLIISNVLNPSNSTTLIWNKCNAKCHLLIYLFVILRGEQNKCTRLYLGLTRLVVRQNVQEIKKGHRLSETVSSRR